MTHYFAHSVSLSLWDIITYFVPESGGADTAKPPPQLSSLRKITSQLHNLRGLYPVLLLSRFATFEHVGLSHATPNRDLLPAQER